MSEVPVTVKPLQTDGFSPKVTRPFLTILLALAATWVYTGTFSREEIAELVCAVIVAGVGWAAPIGRVCVDALQAKILRAVDLSRDESGQGYLGFIIALLVILILVFVLVDVAPR